MQCVVCSELYSSGPLASELPPLHQHYTAAAAAGLHTAALQPTAPGDGQPTLITDHLGGSRGRE